METISYSELLKASHEHLCRLLGIDIEKVASGQLSVERDVLVNELIDSKRVVFN